MKTVQTILTLLVIYLFVTTQSAEAYLDPGTGSYLLQILLASVLGGMYVLRGNVAKVKNFITSLLSKVTGKKKHGKGKK